PFLGVGNIGCVITRMSAYRHETLREALRRSHAAEFDHRHRIYFRADSCVPGFRTNGFSADAGDRSFLVLGDETPSSCRSISRSPVCKTAPAPALLADTCGLDHLAKNTRDRSR